MTKHCKRCGRDSISSANCNHIHNCLRHMIYTYPHDVGNLHIIDRRLYLELRDHRPSLEIPHLRFSPADWSRS